MIRLTSPIRRSLMALPLLLLGCGGDPAPPAAEETTQTAPAAPAPASEQAADFDPFGYYLLESDVPLPDWALTIDHLHLSTIEMQGDQIVSAPLHGLIRSKGAAEGRPGDDYRIANLVLNRQRLTFTTEEVDGISFEFAGQFLQTGNFPENPPQGLVLAGKLRHLQKGEVSGEMNVSFRYEPGD